MTQTAAEMLHESIFNALLVSFYNYHLHMKNPEEDLRKLFSAKGVLTPEQNMQYSAEAWELYQNDRAFRGCVDVTFGMILRRLSFYKVEDLPEIVESRKNKH